MRKTALYIIPLLALFACQESEIQLYSGEEGIYFANRTSAQLLQDSTSFSFIYYDYDSTDVTVKVQTYGRAQQADREYDLSIWSDDAEEGVDYRLLSQPIIPKGETAQDFLVRIYKTAALSEGSKHIHFRLAANENFTTRYLQEISAAGDSTGTLSYEIIFSNTYSVPPAGWVKQFGGTFKPEKLDLLVKLFPEVKRTDYNESGAITYAKWVYMQKTVTDYIHQQLQYYLIGVTYDPFIFDNDGNLLDFEN